MSTGAGFLNHQPKFENDKIADVSLVHISVASQATQKCFLLSSSTENVKISLTWIPLRQPVYDFDPLVFETKLGFFK